MTNPEKFAIETLATGVVVFFISILFYSFRKYLDKKLESAVQLEDIKKLTSLMEGVKQEFIAENERLKTKLSFNSSWHSGLIVMERDAIIEFHNNFCVWMEFLIDPYKNFVNWENNLEVINLQKKEQELFSEMLKTENKIPILSDNTYIPFLAAELRNDTSRIIGTPFKLFVSEIILINESISNIILEENSLKRTNLLNEIKTLKENHFKNQLDNLLSGYNEIRPKLGKFEKECKNHIKSLINKEIDQ